MLNILQCMQVCELQFWKQFVYCKRNMFCERTPAEDNENSKYSVPWGKKLQHLEYF